MPKLLLLLYLMTIVSFSQALYFTIDHHQRCLYEEVTKNTVPSKFFPFFFKLTQKLFKLEFILLDPIPPAQLQDPSSANTHGARVVIFNPHDKAVLYKLSQAQNYGKLSFFSEESEEIK